MKRRAKKRKRPVLVEVEWRDAAGHLSWFEEGKSGELAACVSVGYIIERTKRKIVLAQTVGSSFGRVMTTGHQAIPAGCVVRVRRK